MKESPIKPEQPEPQVEQESPKPKYEPPEVVPLNDIVSGEGGQPPPCNPGSQFFQ